MSLSRKDKPVNVASFQWDQMIKILNRGPTPEQMQAAGYAYRVAKKAALADAQNFTGKVEDYL
jgi:hypothetical protein